ncbi:CDP-diacylglycerol--glycerol-3-phosphate 3-phosphatidyltransferase [Oenococcus alcoholitolerans]|uniref:CDP-diacylglycerol--glycerol-3-phosphate 3-phosphatidyltransferase n=1 Tax=Oenococcus alcoholitolerans TaxID=931074 RepID=A0ABR4XS34_9LACO|nr:CDP-diacylglycerol--glycerol-3-phosphate 3-phosphatidyltransferase [Oenococcus alcoholitolerans]
MNLPNKLTTFRIILIPIFMIVLSIPLKWSLLFGHPASWVVAAVIFAIASLTDFIDGKIARRRHLVTNFGKFADPLADKLIVMTALIFLTSYSVIPAWAVSIIVIRELAVTGLRTLIVEKNGTVFAAQWPGKIKTFTQMFSIIFIFCSDFSLSIPIGQILFYIAVIFTIYSGCEYFIKNRDVFSDGL